MWTKACFFGSGLVRYSLIIKSPFQTKRKSRQPVEHPKPVNNVNQERTVDAIVKVVDKGNLFFYEELRQIVLLSESTVSETTPD